MINITDEVIIEVFFGLLILLVIFAGSITRFGTDIHCLITEKRRCIQHENYHKLTESILEKEYLLRVVLKQNDYCSYCRHVVHLGGGYYECNINKQEECGPLGDYMHINYDMVKEDYIDKVIGNGEENK